MATVVVNSLFKDAVRNRGLGQPAVSKLTVEANSVRKLIGLLDRDYPGIADVLMVSAVAIDGDIYTDALGEPLDEFSEVVFIPALEGG